MADEVSNSSSRPLLPASASATALLLLSTFVAVSGSYVFGCAVGFSSPAQSGILTDLGLTLSEAMWFAELFNLVGWLAIALSKNALWLDIGRLSTGFGVGLLSYVVPVYIAEITPKNLRGAFTAANQVILFPRAVFVIFTSELLNKKGRNVISGTIPCLIQLVGLFFVPESPRWLAKVGKWDGSEASLLRLRGRNADIFEEAAEIREYTRSLEQLKESGLMDLFQRKYAHSLIVGVGLMVLQQFGGVNAIAYYASAIFLSAGFSDRVGTTAMVIVQVPVTVLGTLLMDKSGRRPLLLVSVAGTFLGCFIIGLSFLLQDLKLWDSSPVLALVGVLIFGGSFSLGMGGIPWVIMSEIFPINVKGVAGSMVTVVNWLGSWIITYSFNFLAQWSSAGTFFMFAAVCGVTIIFIVKLVPETKGRTLEEIQESMLSFN
ncbi:sugar transporter ERD6-like 5 isoform X3 [Salvia miltiorrhiza]|uniref:sugar transporter ERD6-like 5 isoform X3 n=1 Tax=Salvia miltiorrhiza TaxID=226208 RepID=UPI0025AC5890|nr:sugar transporter ERD6-like 5 isoform X3 [Salvia miltiorrhiza]